MVKRVFRFGLKLAVIAGLLWMVRAGMKRWIDGPDRSPSPAPWPPLPEPDATAAATGVDHRSDLIRPDDPMDPDDPMKTAATEDVGPAAKIPAVKKTGGPEKAAPAAKSVQKKALPAKKTAGANSGDAASSWIKPDGTGSAPASHPVKAKLSSRVYHLPGMSAYARTKPDRCYSTAEAAEADGFIRAKR